MTSSSIPIAKTEQEDVRLPDKLPGIEVQQGLQQTDGDHGFLKSLFIDFLEDHGETTAEIRAALDRGDQNTAIRLAHTIKGVAGTIGAGDLFESAKQFEQALKLKEDQKYEEYLFIFENTLAIVKNGLEEFVTSQTPLSKQSIPLTSISSEIIFALMEEIKGLMEELDPEAEEKVKDLKNKLKHDTHQDSLRDLLKQVSDFEFDLALMTLDKLKNQFEKLGPVRLGISC